MVCALLMTMSPSGGSLKTCPGLPFVAVLTEEGVERAGHVEEGVEAIVSSPSGLDVSSSLRFVASEAGVERVGHAEEGVETIVSSSSGFVISSSPGSVAAGITGDGVVIIVSSSFGFAGLAP